MAKVKGPLHSDDGGGKFGGVLTFRKGKRGTTVTGYYKPGSARAIEISEAQLAQRSVYGQAVEAWRALSENEKSDYNLRAVALKISGWNLFLKEFNPVPPFVPFDLTFDLTNQTSLELQDPSYLTGDIVGYTSSNAMTLDPLVLTFGEGSDWVHVLTAIANQILPGDVCRVTLNATNTVSDIYFPSMVCRMNSEGVDTKLDWDEANSTKEWVFDLTVGAQAEGTLKGFYFTAGMAFPAGNSVTINSLSIRVISRA